jgi:N-acylglucosamine 2-epimerase
MPTDRNEKREGLWTPTQLADNDKLISRCRKQLLSSVVPFWLENALDPIDGAINTCLSLDGTVLSRDRFIWSQARALWTFSAIYNRIDRRSRYLDVANNIFSYLLEHGRDREGEWVYRVDQFGRTIEGPISWFTAGFAIYGLAEYYRASGESEAADLAYQSYLKIRGRVLRSEGQKLLYPLPSSELSAHSLLMIFGLGFLELGDALQDRKITQDASYCGASILSQFLDQKTGLIFEYRAVTKQQEDSPLAAIVVPGHGIESLWFLGHLCKATQRTDLIPCILQAVKQHLEFGWDEEYGGIFLAQTTDKTLPNWPHWDSKPWWIAVEALYALVFCAGESSEPWIAEWFKKVQQYAYAKYPDERSGEWHQKLDRFGKPTKARIGLPLIDPFHLPRSLILSIEELNRRVR